MRKISRKWQMVILLAVLIFLWAGSSLAHSCRREELAKEAEPLPVYKGVITVADSCVHILPDSLRTKKKDKTPIKKKHKPDLRDYLNEPIPGKK